MTEFTPEWIAKARNACILFGEPATTEFRKALDEIERLQKYKEKLISDATQNEFVLLAYHDSLKEMKARVQELEQEHDYLDTKCAALEVEQECEWHGEYGGYDEHGDMIFFARKTGCSDSHIQKVSVVDYTYCPNCGRKIKYVEEE